VIEDSERVLNILNNELSNLDSICYDWAAWDDTYEFIEDVNQDYIDSNLVDETFVGLKLNLMIFINSSGKIVYAKAFDLGDNREIEIPEDIYEHLGYLSLHKTTDSSITGILALKTPILIASRPILTSEDEGPIRGALIIGRYLDNEEISYLSGITQNKIKLLEYDSSYNPKNITVKPIDDDTIVGLIPLKDVYGKTVYLLEVEMPRNIHKQGIAAMQWIIVFVGVIGATLSVAVILFLDRSVLSRLHLLTDSVIKIRETRDFKSRINIKGDDELAKLGSEINRMLAEIQKSYAEIENLNETLKLINKIMRHDVLNDLTTISLALDMVEVGEKDKKLIVNAFKAIDRSVDLINRMRELETFASFGGELKEYNVRDVIREVVEKYDIKFNIKGDCRVLADEAFTSVIDNVINNAVVHGKTDRIDITIGKTDNFCQIRIADYGIGISDEIKDRIFEEGFKYGDTGHTGLGLYIVKKAVERYGGSIEVEDNKPKGAVFVIRLRCKGSENSV